MTAVPDILLINLDRSPDRMAFMARQLDELGLTFTRLPATDAAAITEADFNRLANTYMRPLSRSEVGCFISHMRAWQHCADIDRPTLVLEDDVFLSEKLPAFLSEFAKLETLGIVNLETRGMDKWVAREPFAKLAQSDVQLYRLYIDRGGAGGYIVMPSAARELLEISRHYAALADAFLNSCGVPRLQVEPGLVSPLYEDGDGRRGLSPNFNTTITQPGKASRLALIVFRPHFKLRRLAGFLALNVRKIKTIGVGIKRKIVICPTILARADNWSV